MCLKFGKCEFCVQDKETCAELGTGEPLCFAFMCSAGERCEHLPCITEEDIPWDWEP